MNQLHSQPGEAPTVEDSAEHDVWKVESVSLDRNGKETNIVVELAGPDPLSDASLRALALEYDGKSRGAYSGRMVCLRGTEFEGIWTPITIKRHKQGGGSTMSCWANYDSTAGWEPMTWGLRPHVPGSNVCIYDKATAAGETSAAQDEMRVAPSLVLHSRMTVFWVDEIDTVGQSFKANFFYELRARGIVERGINAEQQEEFLRVYGLSAEKHPATLSNAVEEISLETWTSISQMQDGLLDFCWKGQSTAKLSESMELHLFPIDIQELQINLSVSKPNTVLSIVENREYKSIFMTKKFKLSALWTVLESAEDGALLALTGKSDACESASQYVYPNITFKIIMARQTGYYWTNVAVPMAVLTCMSTMSAAVEPNGERLPTADRLSVSLTLLLTAVAYKFVVASSLPTVSYWTMLDKYVLLCFCFILSFSLENVIYPGLLVDRSDPDNPEEIIPEIWLVGGYLALFTLFNIYFLIVARITWGKRFRFETSCGRKMSPVGNSLPPPGSAQQRAWLSRVFGIQPRAG